MEKTFIKQYHTYQKHLWEQLIEGKAHDLTKDDQALYQTLKDMNPVKPFLEQAFIDHHPDVSKQLRAIEQQDHPQPEAILRLMKTRDLLAQAQGYDDYKTMIMNLDHIKELSVKKKLIAKLQTDQKRRQTLIKQHGITYDNVFQVVNQIGLKPVAHHPETIMDQLFEQLDIPFARKQITCVIDSNGIAGYAQKIGEGDIRLAARPITSLNHLKTFLHELSHAITKAIQQDTSLNQFLRSQSYEMLAVILENMFIDEVCTQTEKETLRDIQIILDGRLITSALFEFDLNDYPDNIEDVFKTIVTHTMPLEDPTSWSQDTFRFSDPLTIQYYPLGHLAYQNLAHIMDQEAVPQAHRLLWIKALLLDNLTDIDVGGLI